MDDIGQAIFSVSPAVKQAINGFIGTSFLAFLGRLMWHVREVRANQRRFWSLHLLWEVLTAICIGYVADGIAEYFGFDGAVRTGAVVAISYLGPRGVEDLILKGLHAVKAKGGKV